MLCCLLVLLHAYLDPRTAEEADARDDAENQDGDAMALGRVDLSDCDRKNWAKGEGEGER